MGLDHDEISAANAKALEEYLLGYLPHHQRDAIEARLAEDRALYENLLAIEDELIVDYARGRLTPERAGRVEELLRTLPDGSIRIAVARSLPDLSSDFRRADVRNEAISERIRLNRVPRLLWAASAMVLLLVAGLAVMDVRRARIADPARDSAEEPVPPQAAPQSGGPVLTIRLTPGQERASGNLPTLTIPAGERQIRFELEHRETRRPAEFEAAIRPVGGDPVWTGRIRVDAASRDSGQVTILVPSSALGSDEYVLSIAPVFDGRADAALPAYGFSVVNQPRDPSP
jgi:hypothetical protein